MNRLLAPTVVALVCAYSTGLAGATGAGGGAGQGTRFPSAATSADLAFCVSETNRYRAMAGRPPLARSAALESYAAAGAQADAEAGVAHSHFKRTNGGGVAAGENEVVNAPVTMFRSVNRAIAEAIRGFYGEGPRGSHYRILTGQFSSVGCGVYVGNRRITIVQDFR